MNVEYQCIISKTNISNTKFDFKLTELQIIAKLKIASKNSKKQLIITAA